MYANHHFPTSYRYLPLTGGLLFSLVGFLAGLVGFYAYWCGSLPLCNLINASPFGLLIAVLGIPVSTSIFALGGIAVSYFYAKKLKKGYKQNRTMKT